MAKTEKNTFLCAFGEHLAELRRTKGISQEQLAFDADIDLSTISKIERGVLNISVYNAYKIGIALKIDYRELFEFNLDRK